MRHFNKNRYAVLSLIYTTGRVLKSSTLISTLSVGIHRVLGSQIMTRGTRYGAVRSSHLMTWWRGR